MVTRCEVCDREHAVEYAFGWFLLGALAVIVLLGWTILAGRSDAPLWGWAGLWLLIGLTAIARSK